MDDNINTDMPRNTSLYKALWAMLRRMLSLNIELLRLNAAEKLTLFIVAVVTYLLMLILGSFALAFLSNAAVDLLTQALPAWVASLIIAGVYICIIAVIYLFRHTLVIKPIARFVSRLIVEPQTTQTDVYDEQ